MPYIKQDKKNIIDPKLDSLIKLIEDNELVAGDLNYIFTKLIIAYMDKETNYQRMNDCIGALEGCKLEFYRRAVSIYETEKAKQNGDVYIEG